MILSIIKIANLFVKFNGNRKIVIWSERKKHNGMFSKLIKTIRDLLEKISGKKIIEMISDILTEEEKRQIAKKYIDALSGLSEPINNIVKPKMKHFYIYHLRKAGLKDSEARKIGFKFSKHLWTSCTYRNYRRPGGRYGISDSLKDQIAEHLASPEVSAIAANRVIKKRIVGPRNLQEPQRYEWKNTWQENLDPIEMQLKPVFNRIIPVTEAYKNFMSTYDYAESLSVTTFRKYIPKEFKKPYRYTDMCEYCEYGRSLKKNILDYTRNYHTEFFEQENNENFINFNNYIEYFQTVSVESDEATHDDISNDESDADSINENEVDIVNEKKNTDEDIDINESNILAKLNHLQSIEYHRFIAKRQRNIYNLMTSEPSYFVDSILIEFDFKQKIKYGSSPRQKSYEWYNLQEASLLGFIIHYLDQGEIKKIYIDIVSDHLDQDTSSVIRSLDFLQKQEFFRKIDKPNYIIWADCGPHFRSYQLLHYFFVEMDHKNVSINYHAEKHGKSHLDQHFSVISHFLKMENFKRKINCSQDIVDIINARQEVSNLERIQNKQERIEIKCFKHNPKVSKQTQHTKKSQCVVNNMRSYYNFSCKRQNDDLIIESTIFSDLITKINLGAANIRKKDNKFKFEGEKIAPKKKINLASYIDKKRRRIERQNVDIQIDSNLVVNRDVCMIDNYIDEFLKRKNIHRFFFCTDSCKSCKIKSKYRFNDIIDMNQQEINQELSKHGHPQSRDIKSKGKSHKRKIGEAKDEFLFHLINHHKDLIY